MAVLNRDNLIAEFYDAAPPSNAIGLAVRVVGGGGGGGGIQYEEGTMEPFITGTAVLWEDSGNVLRVPSSTYPLPISLAGTIQLGTGSAVIGRVILSDGVDDALVTSGRLHVQSATPVPLFHGRASTFRTPGRAGTAGQKILSLHNATGSPVKVCLLFVGIDVMSTVIKAITVAPPIIRLWKVTVLPTNGTVLTKSKVGGSLSASDAAVTVRGDASADGTGSGTTLTATLPAGTVLTQEWAPRFISNVGYEMADRVEFLNGRPIELGPLEGVVLFLDYTATGSNPVTDMWIATVEWMESTP